jgi:NAD(P) transhydrogenase subunit alpha
MRDAVVDAVPRSAGTSTTISTSGRSRVGVPREIGAGERRVAMVPKVAERLIGKGLDVVVEADAGVGALLPDGLYIDAGASIGDAWSADVVVKVAPPTEEEIGRLRRGGMLIGFLSPLSHPATVRALDEAGVTAFAVESIPRISRAQSMDALSSQANVAGYKAVLLPPTGPPGSSRS